MKGVPWVVLAAVLDIQAGLALPVGDRRELEPAAGGRAQLEAQARLNRRKRQLDVVVAAQDGHPMRGICAELPQRGEKPAVAHDGAFGGRNGLIFGHPKRVDLFEILSLRAFLGIRIDLQVIDPVAIDDKVHALIAFGVVAQEVGEIVVAVEIVERGLGTEMQIADDQGHHAYSPLKSGSRFAKNALTPSMKSFERRSSSWPRSSTSRAASRSLAAAA